MSAECLRPVVDLWQKYQLAMKLVGLTGGIACGKSTVSDWLQRHDVPVVDLDKIVRQLQAPRTAVVYELGRHFAGVVTAEGCLDRAKLGGLIFSDASQRQLLNRVMLKHILRAMCLELLWHFCRGTAVVVLDAPLLFETKGLARICAMYVVVGTSSEKQLERLVKRDGCTEAAALEKIHAQMPLASKLERAHVPIMNLGSVEDLEAHLDAVVAPKLWARAGLWWFLSLRGLAVVAVALYNAASIKLFFAALPACAAARDLSCFDKMVNDLIENDPDD